MRVDYEFSEDFVSSDDDDEDEYAVKEEVKIEVEDVDEDADMSSDYDVSQLEEPASVQPSNTHEETKEKR